MTTPNGRYTAHMSDGTEIAADTPDALARAIAAHAHRDTWATMTDQQRATATDAAHALITGAAA